MGGKRDNWGGLRASGTPLTTMLPPQGPRDILPFLPIIFPVSSCAPQGVSEGLRPWSRVRC